MFKNVCVKVYDGENVIFEKKLKKAAPGEMNRIVLKKEILPENSKKLCFKLEEVK